MSDSETDVSCTPPELREVAKTVTDCLLPAKSKDRYENFCHLLRIFRTSKREGEYQYFYATCMDLDANNPGMLIKVDVKNKSTKTWGEKNCFASEPIFLPTPNSQEEDDGVLLAGLLWGGDDTNHVGLVVLDAKTIKEIGRTEFQTPSPMPICFHGWFIPHKDIKL